MRSEPTMAETAVSIDRSVALGTWVVIPVFNEAVVIARVVRELREVFPNVVCVDDGSGDGSWEAVRAATPHALRHLVNRGQGAALQTGTAYALRRGAERIAHFDADGQHRVEDLARMVRCVADGDCDIALGDRFGGDVTRVPAGRVMVALKTDRMAQMKNVVATRQRLASRAAGTARRRARSGAARRKAMAAVRGAI